MAAAPAIMLAAGVAQGVGAIMEANSKAANLEANASASRYNAALSAQQAENALRVSSAAQIDQRRKANQALGVQRAAIAQSGTGAGGTNQDLLETSENYAELDLLNIAYDGAVRAKGYLAQRDIDEFQARVYESQVGPTKRAGYLTAIGSVGSSLYHAYGTNPKFWSNTPPEGEPGGSGLKVGSGTGFKSSGGTGLRFNSNSSSSVTGMRWWRG